MSLLQHWFGGTRRRRHPVTLLAGSFWRGPAEILESRIFPAAVLVSADPNLETTEAGGTAQFSVKLDTQPTSTVTIRVRSSNSREGTPSVDELVFTTVNWNQSQVVTVLGVNDSVDDDDVTYSIILDKLKTTDKNFRRVNPPDVSITNRDNEGAGIIVTPTSGLQTTEQGGTASFTIRLSTQPRQTVLIAMHSSKILEGTKPDSRLFNKKNWNLPQTVTVTGLNDFVDDGDQPYQILFSPAQGGDPKYIGLVGGPVSLVNLDDDQAGMSVTPAAGLIVNEGGIKNVTVSLNSQPTSEVIVTVSGGNAEASVTPDELVFTPTNWTNPQIFTIHGTLDELVDGDQPFEFTVQAQSTDPVYDGLSQVVSTTIRDTRFFDGTYIGSYTGSVSEGGSTDEVTGEVQFVVSGNSVTVTAPADGSGTLNNNGTGQFSLTSGSVAGADFSGIFTLLLGGGVSASGNWTYDDAGATGIGTWSASRV